MNILQFIAQAKQDNGGSYSLQTGETNPTTGYMVSLKGCEEVHENFPSTFMIREYLRTHADSLWQDNRYFGVWYNSDAQLWYMDVSENVSSLDKATGMGKLNKQIAIWDCSEGKEIKL